MRLGDELAVIRACCLYCNSLPTLSLRYAVCAIHAGLFLMLSLSFGRRKAIFTRVSLVRSVGFWAAVGRRLSGGIDHLGRRHLGVEGFLQASENILWDVTACWW